MRRELLSTGLKVMLVRLVGMGAGFTLTVVLARTLGPAGLGYYTYALALMALAAVPVNGGWAKLLLKETAQASSAETWARVQGLIRWGGVVAIGAALLAFTIGLVVSQITGSVMYGIGVISILAVVLLLDQIAALRLAVLRGLDHPIWGQSPELLLRPFLILAFFWCFVSFAATPVTATAAFLSLLCAATLTAVVGIMILRQKAPDDLLHAKPAADFGAWLPSAGVLTGNALLVNFNNQIDFLLLGALGTAEQAGLYRIAIQIALLSGTAYMALNLIAMQRFAKLYGAGQMNELQLTARYMARIAFVVTLPLPVIFWFAGEQILTFVFGQTYAAANTALLILLGVQSASAFAGFPYTMLIMAKKEKKIVPLTLASVILNIVLCIVLIPIYQLEGAAVSAFCAIVSWNIGLWYVCRAHTTIDTAVLGPSKHVNA